MRLGVYIAAIQLQEITGHRAWLLIINRPAPTFKGLNPYGSQWKKKWLIAAVRARRY
jgi:hypothetical protein